MLNYLFKEKKQFILYIFFLILDGINVALLAYFLKYTFDAANSGSCYRLNMAWLVVGIYLLFYSVVSNCTRHFKANYITKTMFYLKEDLFFQIVNYSIHKFNQQAYASYISIYNNDLELVEKKYFESIFLIIRSIVILICSFVMLIWIQPFVAAAGIILSLLPLVIPKIFEEKLGNYTKKYTDSMKEYNSLLSNYFMGFETIKSFGIKKNVIHLHSQTNKSVEDRKKKSYYVKANADVATNFIAIGTQFAVYLISGYFMIKGVITAGSVIAITQLMYKVVNPVFDVIDQLNNMKSVKSVIKEINEILNYKEEEKEVKNQLEVKRGISFEHVFFRYDGSDFCLKDISLYLEKGKKYVIVGESGSGKSTLVKLLLGYYNNFNGQIWFDDICLKKVNPECLCQMFSVMHQNVFLFDDTIFNNLTLYQDYDLTVVQSVIHQVGLSDCVNLLENNIYTKIQGNGANLSGGEKQRIALARTLLRGSQWVIMDEATSNLDNETFHTIEQQILSLENITCITITHRYQKELLERYDKIFVLKNGELYESGTFQELMEQRGLFYNSYTVFDTV
ncbi:ABC transporter ATP-binding protein [Velocimicrobium porci]|uniref:ABC transporter ATP-binding protein n=1 Tax=Velocimicrobium porci TaxID=2606634 RepID=A0A6L5XYG7_9FIRM|nr:ABC transporter ATP-binding protein [Velocimicrobium porci]MSS63916.1 ABC transporter ATP-binding protein [Velocimicrobium porci]